MKIFSPEEFRKQFPAIDPNAVFLDSAATALKPQAMIDATHRYYTHNSGATVHRSHHQKAQQVTAQFEQARALIADFIHASNANECIWTKGTSESINLVSQGYFRSRLQPSDEIIISEQEHHSNLIPWLIVAEQTGAKIIKWPLNQQNELDTSQLATLLTEKTRVIAISEMSNVTGYQPNLAAITNLAHQYDNCLVVVDGAQGIVHQSIDVNSLGIDFYALSAHKLYGPNGLGVLYGRSELLEQMSPWQGGGKMLVSVSFEGFTPAPIPARFEAGTPNIAAVIGFGATLDWLKSWNLHQAHQYAISLCDEAEHRLSSLPGFISYRAKKNSPLLAFNFAGIHHSDIATILSEQHIALRHGQHCAQPLIDTLNISGCLRASFMPYNNIHDIDRLEKAIKLAISLLSDEE